MMIDMGKEAKITYDLVKDLVKYPTKNEMKKKSTGDFFGERNKITSQVHVRKFEEQTAGLRICALQAVIYDIHRVFCVSADPVDVRNGSQQDTCPQAIYFLKFSDLY